MRVTVARHAGFCFGVKRAVNIAFSAAQGENRGPLYTLGPLIHNPQVVEKLETMGIKSVDSLGNLEEGRVIVRSHGVPPQVLVEAEEKGMKIIDATCPFVKKAQQKVAELVEQGFWVFIVGDRHHPEVQALLGYGKGRACLMDDMERVTGVSKVGIVCQTTQSQESLARGVSKVLSLLGGRLEELRIHNTICESTLIRQKECMALAETSDVVIVVGGKNSANTTRLAEISKAILEDTHHIEDAEELDPQWFRGKRRIGVTAGASTPDWIIGEVVERIKLIGGNGKHGREDGREGRNHPRGAEIHL